MIRQKFSFAFGFRVGPGLGLIRTGSPAFLQPTAVSPRRDRKAASSGQREHIVPDIC